MVIKGQKARRAMVYGIDGVLDPVQRNCDEKNTVSRHVSNSMILAKVLKCQFLILIDVYLRVILQVKN